MAIKKDIERFDWENGWIEVEATLNGTEAYTCTFEFNTVNEAFRFKSENGTVPSLRSYLEMLREVRLFISRHCHWSSQFIRRLRRIELDDGMEHGRPFMLSQAALIMSAEDGDCLWVDRDDVPLRLSPPGDSARFFETRTASDMLKWFIAAEIAPSVCAVISDNKELAPEGRLKDLYPNRFSAPADTRWSVTIKKAA